MVNGKQTTNVRQIRQNFGKSKNHERFQKGRNIGRYANNIGET